VPLSSGSTTCVLANVLNGSDEVDQQLSVNKLLEEFNRLERLAARILEGQTALKHSCMELVNLYEVKVKRLEMENANLTKALAYKHGFERRWWKWF
jgi:hypothetical protein